MTIFEALRKDHDHQRELAEGIVKTQGDTKTRHGLWLKFKDSLEKHAAMEERYFYSPLIDSDMTIEKARHSIAEHNELDELIEKLDDTGMDTAEWLKTFKHLKHRLFHHLDEEEKEVFPVAGKVLSENQKESLAKNYDREMEERQAS